MDQAESLSKAISEKIEIRPYDPVWPARFVEERERLSKLFPGAFAAIEHVGSTSVPGLSAKPVIDIMAGVHTMPEADRLLPELCLQDYVTSAEFNATLLERRWLMRHHEGRRTIHLHIVLFQNNEWKKTLKFRDVLRTRPDIAADYADLKYRLSAAHSADREAYTRAKDTFIEGILSAC